ncbi:MAG: alpha/beta hydrolase [Lentisphaerales bacterium]|nr:alpha/beta hydrolase [Lentisphaerales bacterium]
MKIVLITSFLLTCLAVFAADEQLQKEIQRDYQKQKVNKSDLLPTLKDVAYGDDPRQTLNFWQVKAKKPLGILVHIHGGGWRGGDKLPSLKKAPEAYHSASITYPLTKDGDTLPSMVHSAARAIQFIRYKAQEWNIDPKRIVVTGGSAGGASSYWLAFHDDLADPDNPDPVLRESTRVSGAVINGGQSTLDPFLIQERIGDETLKHHMLYKPLGLQSVNELMDGWQTYKKLSNECTGLAHISKDDPPVYMNYGKDRTLPAKNNAHGIHHFVFGLLVKEKCDQIGLKTYLKSSGYKDSTALSSEEYIEQLLIEE